MSNINVNCLDHNNKIIQKLKSFGITEGKLNRFLTLKDTNEDLKKCKLNLQQLLECFDEFDFFYKSYNGSNYAYVKTIQYIFDYYKKNGKFPQFDLNAKRDHVNFAKRENADAEYAELCNQSSNIHKKVITNEISTLEYEELCNEWAKSFEEVIDYLINKNMNMLPSRLTEKELEAIQNLYSRLEKNGSVISIDNPASIKKILNLLIHNTKGFGIHDLYRIVSANMLINYANYVNGSELTENLQRVGNLLEIVRDNPLILAQMAKPIIRNNLGIKLPTYNQKITFVDKNAESDSYEEETSEDERDDSLEFDNNDNLTMSRESDWSNIVTVDLHKKLNDQLRYKLSHLLDRDNPYTKYGSLNYYDEIVVYRKLLDTVYDCATTDEFFKKLESDEFDAPFKDQLLEMLHSQPKSTITQFVTSLHTAKNRYTAVQNEKGVYKAIETNVESIIQHIDNILSVVSKNKKTNFIDVKTGNDNILDVGIKSGSSRWLTFYQKTLQSIFEQLFQENVEESTLIEKPMYVHKEKDGNIIYDLETRKPISQNKFMQYMHNLKLSDFNLESNNILNEKNLFYNKDFSDLTIYEFVNSLLYEFGADIVSNDAKSMATRFLIKYSGKQVSLSSFKSFVDLFTNKVLNKNLFSLIRENKTSTRMQTKKLLIKRIYKIVNPKIAIEHSYTHYYDKASYQTYTPINYINNRIQYLKKMTDDEKFSSLENLSKDWFNGALLDYHWYSSWESDFYKATSESGLVTGDMSLFYFLRSGQMNWKTLTGRNHLIAAITAFFNSPTTDRNHLYLIPTLENKGTSYYIAHKAFATKDDTDSFGRINNEVSRRLFSIFAQELHRIKMAYEQSLSGNKTELSPELIEIKDEDGVVLGKQIDFNKPLKGATFHLLSEFRDVWENDRNVNSKSLTQEEKQILDYCKRYVYTSQEFDNFPNFELKEIGEDNDFDQFYSLVCNWIYNKLTLRLNSEINTLNVDQLASIVLDEKDYRHYQEINEYLSNPENADNSSTVQKQVEAKKIMDDEINNKTKHWYFNHYYANSQFLLMFAGDPAIYKDVDTLTKRLSQLSSSGVMPDISTQSEYLSEGTTSKTTKKIMVFDDIERESETGFLNFLRNIFLKDIKKHIDSLPKNNSEKTALLNKAKRKVENKIKPYKTINGTDGQSIMSIKFLKEYWTQLGQMNETIYKILDVLEQIYENDDDTIDLQFFQDWVKSLESIHKLSNQDIELISLFLLKRQYLSKSIVDSEALDNVLFSKEVEKEICETMGISTSHFQVLMDDLRNEKVINNGTIDPKFIPNDHKLIEQFRFNFLNGLLVTYDELIENLDSTFDLNTLKTFSYSTVLRTEKNANGDVISSNKPINIKTADMICLDPREFLNFKDGRPHYDRNNLMYRLQNLMLRKNIDGLCAKSALKVYAPKSTSITIAKENDNIENVIRNFELNSENSDYVIEFPIQYNLHTVVTKSDFEDLERVTGIQFQKLILETLNADQKYNIKLNGSEYTYNGVELKALVDSLQAKQYELACDELLEKFTKIDKSTASYEEKQNMINHEVSQLLIKQLENSDVFSFNTFRALLLKDGKFDIPLSTPGLYTHVQKLIISIAKNDIISQTMPGGDFIQIANIVNVKDAIRKIKDGNLSKEELNEITSSDLDMKFEYATDGKTITGIKWMEVEIPFYLKNQMKKYLDDNGMFKMNDIPEELKEIIGYRIPTEGLCSIFAMRVKRFSSPHAGGNVKVPAKMTAISGSDFDIDKVYFIRHAFNANGDVIPSDFETIDGINNTLFEIYKAILLHPDNQAERMSPQGFETVTRMSKAMEYLAQLKNTDIPENIKQSIITKLLLNDYECSLNDIIDSRSPCDPFVQIDLRSRNQIAARAIGIAAVHRQVHAMLLGKNIKVKSNLPDIKIKFSNLKINGDSLLNSDKTINFDSEYCHDNITKVSDVLREFLGASVDAAKKPIFGQMNLNLYTFDIACTLARLGFTVEDISLILRQPIITDFIQNCEIKAESSKKGYVDTLDVLTEMVISNFGDKPMNVDFDFTHEQLINGYLNFNDIQQKNLLPFLLGIAKISEDTKRLNAICRTDSLSGNTWQSMYEYIATTTSNGIFLAKLKTENTAFDSELYNVFTYPIDERINLPVKNNSGIILKKVIEANLQTGKFISDFYHRSDIPVTPDMWRNMISTKLLARVGKDEIDSLLVRDFINAYYSYIYNKTRKRENPNYTQSYYLGNNNDNLSGTFQERFLNAANILSSKYPNLFDINDGLIKSSPTKLKDKDSVKNFTIISYYYHERSPQFINNAQNEWERMFYDNTEIMPGYRASEFAQELLDYLVMKNGFDINNNSFVKLIPYNITSLEAQREQKFSKALYNCVTTVLSDKELDTFVDLFIRHNKKIIPRVENSKMEASSPDGVNASELVNVQDYCISQKGVLYRKHGNKFYPISFLGAAEIGKEYFPDKENGISYFQKLNSWWTSRNGQPKEQYTDEETKEFYKNKTDNTITFINAYLDLHSDKKETLIEEIKKKTGYSLNSDFSQLTLQELKKLSKDLDKFYNEKCN